MESGQQSEAQRVLCEQHNASLRLFQLPAELYQQIVEAVVQGEQTVEIRKDCSAEAAHNRQYGFLHACRALRDSLSPIFWPKVKFYFDLRTFSTAKATQQFLQGAPSDVVYRKAYFYRTSPQSERPSYLFRKGASTTNVLISHVDLDLDRDRPAVTNRDDARSEHMKQVVALHKVYKLKRALLELNTKGRYGRKGLSKEDMLKLVRLMVRREWEIDQDSVKRSESP